MLLVAGSGMEIYMSVYLLNSPDSRVNLRIALDNGVLTYSVHRDQETVIESSPVGAIMENADLTCALTTVSECYDEINESYTIPAFKKSHCVNHCNTPVSYTHLTLPTIA